MVAISPSDAVSLWIPPEMVSLPMMLQVFFLKFYNYNPLIPAVLCSAKRQSEYFPFLARKTVMFLDDNYLVLTQLSDLLGMTGVTFL